MFSEWRSWLSYAAQKSGGEAKGREWLRSQDMDSVARLHSASKETQTVI